MSLIDINTLAKIMLQNNGFVPIIVFKDEEDIISALNLLRIGEISIKFYVGHGPRVQLLVDDVDVESKSASIVDTERGIYDRITQIASDVGINIKIKNSPGTLVFTIDLI